MTSRVASSLAGVPISSVPDAAGFLKATMEGNGILPSEVVLDGQIHRCGTADKPQGQNGWYVAHGDVRWSRKIGQAVKL